MATPPQLTPPPIGPSPARRVTRWIVWVPLWVAGVVIGGASAMQLAADRHTWDARVSLPVREAAAAASETFRTFTGGEVNVLATSLVHGQAGPFEGTIALRILGADGSVVREFRLGRGGIAHTQAGVSSWTTLGQVDAPRLWIRPWRLEARVIAADPNFPAKHIDLILRKQRRELGMGGMAFYVTILVGLLLLAITTLLAIAWRETLGHAPWVASAVALVVIAVLAF